MEQLILSIINRGWQITFQKLPVRMPGGEPSILCTLMSQEMPAARCPEKSRLVRHCQITKSEFEKVGTLEAAIRSELTELRREYDALPRVDAYGQPLDPETL